jgi:hypothetical protein
MVSLGRFVVAFEMGLREPAISEDKEPLCQGLGSKGERLERSHHSLKDFRSKGLHSASKELKERNWVALTGSIAKLDRLASTDSWLTDTSQVC